MMLLMTAQVCAGEGCEEWEGRAEADETERGGHGIERQNVLVRACLDMASRAGANDGLSRFSCTAGPGGRQSVARGTMGVGVSRRTLAVVVGHALRGQIAVVHALGAVLARRATILVDALGLAFATAHTGAASPEGGRAHNAGRHGLRVRDEAIRGGVGGRRTVPPSESGE